MSVRDKWVRRFSVDETAKHKNGFTIYKITSVLFPLESPEAVTVVSVWKRYSDVQQLHKSMKSLHAGLHLRGTFPLLAKSSYFKRFQQEVIEERAKTIKALLEFVAEHRLLFTSTDFVNFLQTGYPEPEPSAGGVINAIRSSLHLPIEDTPPLEYQTSDDETRSPSVQLPRSPQRGTDDETIDVSQIPIYEAADVEIRESPKTTEKLSNSDSFESINSLESLGSDLYDELSKVTIDNKRPFVKKNVLPDLINFDVPSTSKFEDYHTMPTLTDSETASLASTTNDPCGESRRSSSRVSLYSRRSVLSLSNVESRTRTEDSYIFEAGYMLNLAARCEDMGDYQRAFECYKSGIEKMLIGVQTDTDQQRRALIKEKTNKYLAYAEAIYKNHLSDVDQSLLLRQDGGAARLHCSIPLGMLRKPRDELARYRVLGVLGASVMLVLHETDHTCYAMKVIQKIPNNLTEFDDYFHQRTNETRQPILPTVIPYMVPLHAYVETNNLLFLILAYAPGERLFDYIKNYAKSIPNTPARELNLENVFAEPKKRDTDIQNDNIESIDVTDAKVNVKNKIDTKPTIEIDSQLAVDVLDNVNENVDKTDSMGNVEVSVNELVLNSQKLLLNVDKALTDVPRICEEKEEDRVQIMARKKEESVERIVSKNPERVETPTHTRVEPHACPRDVLPPSGVCLWGAQLLTALESLHNAGVVCRDLNPSNILLGSQGQIILTYMVSYAGRDVFVAQLHRKRHGRAYVAPELHHCTYEEKDDGLERVCDFWTFGAIMYELICGYPLSRTHPRLWSHTTVQLPDGLPLEARSLLTQLLTYDPAERLGAGGIDDIKRHPYFRHIDWSHVYDSWLVPD